MSPAVQLRGGSLLFTPLLPQRTPSTTGGWRLVPCQTPGGPLWVLVQCGGHGFWNHTAGFWFPALPFISCVFLESSPMPLSLHFLIGKIEIIKVLTLDFSGGSVGESPSANAGDMGSICGLGRFHMPWSKEPHVLQVLSPFAATTKVHSPTVCAQQRRVASTHHS